MNVVLDKKPVAQTDGLKVDQSTDTSPDYKEYIFSEAWREHRGPEYEAYRRDWDSVPRNRTELDFAINVDIETTDVCNLKCPMCPRTFMENAGSIENRLMTREEYASIIDQAVEHGAKAVKLNYNGEPLAHKDIVWQVQYAKDKGILDVLINTNATLLRKDIGKKLLEAGIDGVFVSQDALSPDLYEEQRVGTTLGKVVDNLYSFVQLRNKIRPGCQIRISMVMFNDPKWIEQFEGLRVMWQHLVDALGYSPVVDYEAFGNVKFPKVDNWTCGQPFQRIVLKVNGNVTVCCPDTWDALTVGNWRTEKLYDIWHGEKFTEIRRKHREGNYHEIDTCARCTYPLLEKSV